MPRYRPTSVSMQQLSLITVQTQEIPRLEGVSGDYVLSLGHAEKKMGVGNEMASKCIRLKCCV